MRALLTFTAAVGLLIAQPSINNVQNNSSLVPDGFPNSGVSPSSLIVIHGSNMADPSAPLVLWDVTNKPLQKTLNGATINVAINGTTVNPGIYYTSPTQIAAVLPSNTPTGTGTITVSYNGQISAPASIKVIPSAFGVDNYGSNTAVAQDSASSTGALYTPTNSAKPGGFVTLWGTGLGRNPDTSTDTTYTTNVSNISTQTDIYVGGVKATDVRYAGASVYPGVQILVFVIPQGAPAGCFVPITIITGGTVVSNTPTIPIADNGGVCNEPQFNLTGSTIAGLTGQSAVRTGSVLLAQITSQGANGSPQTSNVAETVFNSTTVSGSSFAGLASIGSCIIGEVPSTGGSTVTALDPGQISATGPVGSYNLALSPAGAGIYIDLLPSNAIPPTGGSFNFKWTGGNGQNSVGASNATVTLPNPIMSWTNQSIAATMNRSQGLLVTWTGGAPGSTIVINGNSAANGINGSYTCYAPQSAFQFQVPSYVIGTLPAGQGFTRVQNYIPYSTFTAPGLDFGFGIGFTSIGVNSVFQ